VRKGGLGVFNRRLRGFNLVVVLRLIGKVLYRLLCGPDLLLSLGNVGLQSGVTTELGQLELLVLKFHLTSVKGFALVRSICQCSFQLIYLAGGSFT
jgi:hypothetical protein